MEAVPLHTISLDRHLLNRSHLLLDLGHPTEARALLVRLIDRPELADEMKAEAHRLLGEIAFHGQRFRRARRHFREAICLQPRVAETYVSFALAVETDPDANPVRAWKALRRAVRLNPDEPRYWTAFGQIALRLRKPHAALEAFRQASNLGPDRVSTIADIVDGFLCLGREDEARSLLLTIHFRHPHDASVAGLWDRFRFESTRRRQARRDESTAVLAFPGRTGETKSPAAGVIRTDRFSMAGAHLFRLVGFDPKRAR
jgi:tetratricopeptide (TPR) repeat protein